MACTHLQQPGAPFGQHLKGGAQQLACPDAPPPQHCEPAAQHEVLPPALGAAGRQQVEPVTQQLCVSAVPQQNASPPQQLAERALLQHLARSPQQRPSEGTPAGHQAQPAPGVLQLLWCEYGHLDCPSPRPSHHFSMSL